MTDQLSTQIYKSRDETRNSIIEYMKQYLELDNIDLTKSTYLSFLVNTLSTLTSNLIFYQSSIYKEFFLTKAQLDESIYSLSSFLGYTTKKAKYSEVDLLFTIPLTFQDEEITITIPEGFTITTDNIEFKTYFKIIITIENNTIVTVKAVEENKSYNLSVFVDPNVECYFLLPVKQIKENRQEFQIDEDLKSFQFVNIDVPLESKLSDLTVFVKSPGSDILEEYTEYTSLFLMSSTDKGFVQRRISEGVRLYFGNGLIGYQPEPNSTVIVDTIETKGEDGNIMPGTITDGERIYIQDNDERLVLNYTITNVNSSSGGKNEESLEEIRQNSITNLVSMNRLVSSFDYDNIDKIASDVSNLLGNNSTIAVLKRSDLKINEIQIFFVISNNDQLIPIRNEIIETNNTYIPRYTEISVDGYTFITPFDITIDPINKVATYEYFIDEITLQPKLDISYNISQECNLILPSIKFERNITTNVVSVDVNYYVLDEGYDLNIITANLQVYETQKTYELTNNIYELKLETTIPIDEIVSENLNFLINIYLDEELFRSYSTSLVIKEDLSDKMLSNVVLDTTTGEEDLYIVYDIPVGLKSYLEQEEIRKLFEQYVMQKLVSVNLDNYRMLTDFISIKLTNTLGTVKNMLLNETKGSNIISIVEEIPDSPSIGDRYIIKNTGSIATYKGSDEWSYIIPKTNTMLYIESVETKMLFNGERWISPTFVLPITIQLEIFVSEDTLLNENEIVQTIKNSLYDQLSPHFAPQFPLYRSEIINIVHSIEKIKYCYLIIPSSDIFFNYNLNDFTQEQLLEYSPEFIYFTKDSINIKVFRG